VHKADNLTTILCQSGNPNFLEPSGPLQACNGTALPFAVSYAKVLLILKANDQKLWALY